MLSLVTAPAAEPFSTDAAKQHLRVDLADEDTPIDLWIVAAREYAELATGRALITQSWDWKLDAFPRGSTLWVPKPPVSAVSSITYVDTAGDSQTWAEDEYLTDLPAGPQAQAARITPAYGVAWPSTYGVMNAVTVRFVAGYGAAGSSIPALLRAAMLMVVGEYYAQRESPSVVLRPGDIPRADRLFWSFKVAQ